MARRMPHVVILLVNVLSLNFGGMTVVTPH